MGLAFTPLNALGVSELTKMQMTSASGVANTVKQLSGSVGIAIFTAIIASSYGNDTLPHSIAESHYNKAIDLSFAIAAIFSFIGLVAVLFLHRRKE